MNSANNNNSTSLSRPKKRSISALDRSSSQTHPASATIAYPPTNYLWNPEPPSCKPEASRSSCPTQQFLYGLEIPPVAPPDVCAACRTTKDDIVLLCDGPCQNEYHLSCTNLQQVPTSHHWYCQDCSAEGTTAALRASLEANDELKAAATSAAAYREELWRLDTQDVQESNLRRPVSELRRARFLDATARQPIQQPVELAADSDASSPHRTRHQSHQQPPTVVEPLDPAFFLGKPVRMFVPQANDYHTGRIVDWRRMKHVDDDSATDEAIDKVEYLVRFAAGSDLRKTAYLHWIVLEDHSLAVGTTLVWGDFHGKGKPKFVPALLWLRTARELVPVQHLLREPQGEIVFEEAATKPSTEGQQQQSVQQLLHQQPQHAWALARSFGAPSEYRLLHLQDEAVNLLEASSQYNTTKELQARLDLAMAEYYEQESVRQWHALKQVRPYGARALSSRDAYTLGPVPLKGISSSEKPRHAQLCPLVPCHGGLDRRRLLNTLQRQGVQATKDVAASLKVQLAPHGVGAYLREKEQQELLAACVNEPTSTASASSSTSNSSPAAAIGLPPPEASGQPRPEK